MDNLDDLKLRIERVTVELKDIIQLFEIEIADPRKAVSFRQVKEIETSIERLRRIGLPVPEELKQLKLKLLSDLSEKALDGLPGKEILLTADAVLERLDKEMQQFVPYLVRLLNVRPKAWVKYAGVGIFVSSRFKKPIKRSCAICRNRKSTVKRSSAYAGK
jgi:hypothetical protein